MRRLIRAHAKQTEHGQPTASLPPRHPQIPLAAFMAYPAEALAQQVAWPQLSGKTKLAPWMSALYMPLVVDRRVQQLTPTQASVLVSPQTTYLIGSTGEHSGTYGKIRPAVDLRTGDPAVVKVVRRLPRLATTPNLTRAGHRQTVYYDHVDAQAVREAGYMQRFGGLQEFVTDERRHYFVMPHGQQSFSSMLFCSDPVLRGEMARVAGWQMLEQAARLHAHGVVHSDLKPDNMLFDARKGQLHVIDFGLTEPFDAKTQQTKQGVLHGTYPPPTRFVWDMVDGEPYVSAQTPATPYDDVWAIGVSILQILAPHSALHEDPFFWRNMKDSGGNSFWPWMSNMRAHAVGGAINLSASNPCLYNNPTPSVQALHDYTAKAYAVDPALTTFVVSHLLSFDVHSSARADTLAAQMWRSNLLDTDTWIRGRQALIDAFPPVPHSDDERMLEGLRQLSTYMTDAMRKPRPLPPIPQAA